MAKDIKRQLHPMVEALKVIIKNSRIIAPSLHYFIHIDNLKIQQTKKPYN